MDPGLIWILAGLALLGAELLLPGVFFLWIGLAAICTGLSLLVVGLGFGGAVTVFLAALAAGIAVSLSLRRHARPPHPVNTPDAGLAGRHATVLGEDNNGLRVRLGDSDWAARLPRGVETPAPGTRVRVEAVSGTVLVVRPEA
jgi:membrane protein implicated in regulation of membrane protease activity